MADQIEILAPIEAPLLDIIGDADAPVKSVLHEWNGGKNYTQILFKNRRVPEAVPLAHRQVEMARERTKRLSELLCDLQYAVVNGKINAGSPMTDPRLMSGLIEQIGLQPVPEIATDGVVTACNEMVDCGLTPNLVLCQAEICDRAFAGTRTLSSPRWTAKIVPYRWMPKGALLVLDTSRIALRPISHNAFYSTKDMVDWSGATVGTYYCEYALEVRDADKMRGFAGDPDVKH